MKIGFETQKMGVGQAKKFFFDRGRVQRAADRGTRRVLSRFGAYVRTTSRNSIKRGGKDGEPSRPGRPPKSWTGDLKRYIYFTYERQNKSVAIGPAATNQTFFTKDRRPAKGTIPSVLEHGGKYTVLEKYNDFAKKWYRADLRSKRRLKGARTRWRQVSISPRPYMRPAFDKTLPKLPAMWADSIK